MIREITNDVIQLFKGPQVSFLLFLFHIIIFSDVHQLFKAIGLYRRVLSICLKQSTLTCFHSLICTIFVWKRLTCYFDLLEHCP